MPRALRIFVSVLITPCGKSTITPVLHMRKLSFRAGGGEHA